MRYRLGIQAALPSLLIGFLYKLIHGASVILDIDDDEAGVVRADRPLDLDEFLSERAPSDWREPYAKRWTAARGLDGGPRGRGHGLQSRAAAKNSAAI